MVLRMLRIMVAERHETRDFCTHDSELPFKGKRSKFIVPVPSVRDITRPDGKLTALDSDHVPEHSRTAGIPIDLPVAFVKTVLVVAENGALKARTVVPPRRKRAFLTRDLEVNACPGLKSFDAYRAQPGFSKRIFAK